MKAIFLTSGPEFTYKKEKGNLIANKLENKELVECLKNEIENYNNLLLVCSSPDNYDKTDKYSEQIWIKRIKKNVFGFF